MKWYYSMWFPVLWLVPLPLRDVAYRIIAKNRHRVFKRPATCVFPGLNID
jgi:predicted DCC family thiol-disulfide oxidoreductase YuxK